MFYNKAKVLNCLSKIWMMYKHFEICEVYGPSKDKENMNYWSLSLLWSVICSLQWDDVV